MENNNCPDCGAAIRIVPAGVSKKTGRPYNEFQVCSKCEWKPQPKGKFYPANQEGVKAEYIKEAQQRKTDSIAYFNAFNAAIELVKIPIYKGLTKEEKQELLNEVWELQDKIYQKHILGL